ncbi:MFS transporter [Zhaonella formicivorans]|uniref:MFS transporter n=1 Tax=Zhaonella formicivorans TaxID=2528593 RepID=UPI001D0FB9AB|nr:MFS transporter [Zhaonella formicivorans]
MIKASTGTNSTLRLLELLIFLLSIGEGLTAPAIPLLGQKLGASYSYIGFFMTGYAFAYALMTIIAGRLSDHLGRKRLLLFSTAVAMSATAGYYFASNAWLLMLFRALEGMSRGIFWPVAGALLADNTTSADSNLAAGRFSAAYGTGVALGNLWGGYLMQYVDLKAVFPFYPFLSLAAFFLVSWFLNENKVAQQAAYHKRLKTGSIAWQEIKRIWPICFVGFAYSGFLYSLSGLLSLVAVHYNVSYLGIGVIFALFWCCRLIAFVGAGWSAGRIGCKPVLLAGIALAALAAAMFLMARQFWLIAAAAVLGGIGTGIMYPLTVALIADSASPSYRGFDMGFMELTAALGMIIQTALAGILGQLGGVQITYLFALVVCLIAIVITALFVNDNFIQTDGGQHSLG